ncbi:MAG: DUF983 domain-containing protein [Acetobacteraceae bacterium]
MLLPPAPPGARTTVRAPPTLGAAVARGVANRCPACGQGRLFSGYLRVAERCGQCCAPLGRIRADDAPPYFTIFIVGHVVVPLMLAAERAMAPSLWAMAAVFLPLTAAMSLLLLRPVKGATIGLMMRVGIDGGGNDPGVGG